MSAADLLRLERIVDASGVAERIETLLPIGVRPRQLTVRTLLVGVLLALAEGRPAHLVRVRQALLCLPDADKRRLGVTCAWKGGPHLLSYRQTERTFALVNRALCKQAPDGVPSETLGEIMDRLLEASVKALGGVSSASLAIDWSGYESFARPPRRRRAAGGEAVPKNAATNGEDAVAQAAHQQGEEEDAQMSCDDREAAWGHRKTNHPAKNELFFGYYLQAATIVKDERGGQVPELVRRITLASCAHDPPERIVPVLERMAAEGIALGDLLADSGYSYRQAETFAAPLRAIGAKLIIDLHPNDRGMKGTHQGAICAHGALYCPATPKALFELSPLPPAATEQQAQEHDRRCEELARYKLSPISAPDKDGYRRVACPAVKGKLRCPHRPASMALSHERPTVGETPEHPPPCCSQQTITIAPAVGAKTAQKHDWPSAAHRASYARRTASERTFSRLYDPAATDISRGWCRLMGLAPNALMLACAAVIANIRTAEAFAARQAEDERRRRCGLPPRRRRRRRSLHSLAANANAPPAMAA